MVAQSHQILFEPFLATAIDEGEKDQTRRVISRLKGYGKIRDFRECPDRSMGDWIFTKGSDQKNVITHRQALDACPYGQVGDFLYVKEPWRVYGGCAAGDPLVYQTKDMMIHVENMDQSLHQSPQWYAEWRRKIEEDPHDRWRSRLLMPRICCRLWLKITHVSIEPLQSIDEDGAVCEGVECVQDDPDDACSYLAKNYLDKKGDHPWFWNDAVASFQSLWDSINAERGYQWFDNPFVWVVRFKRVSPQSLNPSPSDPCSPNPDPCKPEALR